MKTAKILVLQSGKRVPAGTELQFVDGVAEFDGERISLARIPYDACEYQMNEALHSAVWDGMAIKQDVRDMLVALANDFYKESGFKAPVVDIILTGSMANYNWHDKSDLDVHVVINYADEDDNVELVKNAATAIKWKWNKVHNISVQGHDVEMYIQDASEPHVASGVYSLLNDAWIIEPTVKTINTSESAVAAKAAAIREQANQLEQQILNADYDDLEDLLQDVDELRYQALRLRKDAFADGFDEFSVGNLAFKELRNDGTIGKLLDLENRLYDRLHTID